MIFKKNIGDHLLLKLTFLHFFHQDFSQSLVDSKKKYLLQLHICK